MSQRSLFAVALVLGLATCPVADTVAGRGMQSLQQPVKELVVGVKIYEHKGDRQRLFADFRDLGFNTLFVNEALAADDQFRTLAAEHRMAVFVIQPVFYDPEELKKDSDLYAITNAGKPAQHDWVAFVCPSREEYRRRRAEAIAQTVACIEPDGVSFDFIRFFAYWETIHPDRSYASIPNTCFCPKCLERFARETGISLPNTVTTAQQAAEWIEVHHLDEWTAWKCGIIGSMVEDIVRRVREVQPRIRVNLHAVPWRQEDFGGAIRKVVAQDLAALSKFTDYVSPMCYSAMLQREPTWIASVVQDFRARSACPILPSIQVKGYYAGDKSLGTADFEACLRAAVQPPSTGVVFWSWDLIDKAPETRVVIKRHFNP